MDTLQAVWIEAPRIKGSVRPDKVKALYIVLEFSYPAFSLFRKSKLHTDVRYVLGAGHQECKKVVCASLMRGPEVNGHPHRSLWSVLFCLICKGGAL